MKYLLALSTLSLIFMGCSQESEHKEKESGIQVIKEVKKSADKKEALVCIDTDEKITCKLLTDRVNEEREVAFEWKSPNGKDDREREMILPANHASIFDARSKKGRAKGKWEVEVSLDDEEVATSFVIN